MERLSESLLLPLLRTPTLGSLWDSLGYVLCVCACVCVWEGGGRREEAVSLPVGLLDLAPSSILSRASQPLSQKET